MNFKYTAIAFTALSLTVSSCNDFLDEMPDNRTELDTPEKITKLLVTAYPTTSWNLLAEFFVGQHGRQWSQISNLRPFKPRNLRMERYQRNR